MSSAPVFKFLPLSYPEDIEHLVNVEYHCETHDEAKDSEDEYRQAARPRMEAFFKGKEASRKRMLKVVVGLDDGEEDKGKGKDHDNNTEMPTMVAYTIWTAPSENETENENENGNDPPSFKTVAPTLPSSTSTTVATTTPTPKTNQLTQSARFALLQTQDALLSSRYLGPEFSSKYWCLDALATHLKYQHRGLGTRLAKWGIEQAEADAKARPGSVDGVYVIASEAGAKIYMGLGMAEIGRREGLKGLERDDEAFRHVWYVRRF
ncbi:hypothetical protein MMC09_006317 [Bachmanniomyces sp. S44760]|nr:hypothetical protein [Bachmanniomyces sp. S44760]